MAGQSDRYEWDERKRVANVAKHRVNFHDPLVDIRPDTRPANEERGIAIGEAFSRLLVVVFTETDDSTRIISARKATAHERRRYQEGQDRYEREAHVRDGLVTPRRHDGRGSA